MLSILLFWFVFPAHWQDGRVHYAVGQLPSSFFFYPHTLPPSFPPCEAGRARLELEEDPGKCRETDADGRVVSDSFCMVIGLLLFTLSLSLSRVFPYFHFPFSSFSFPFFFLGEMGGQRVSQSIPVVGVFFLFLLFSPFIACLPPPPARPLSKLGCGEHVFPQAGVC